MPFDPITLSAILSAAGSVKGKISNNAGTAVTLGTYLANRDELKAPVETARSIAQEQQLSAAKLYGQLGERPEMDAQVNRLQSLYDIVSQGMPEESMSAATQDIEQTQSQALRDISSRGGGLRGAGTVQANTNRAFRDLNALDAEMARSGQLQVGGQLAAAEAIQEAYNEISPYEEMFGRIQGLMGASQQNRMLAANLGSDLAAKNIQMGAELGGALFANNQSKQGGQGGGFDFSSIFGGGQNAGVGNSGM